MFFSCGDLSLFPFFVGCCLFFRFFVLQTCPTICWSFYGWQVFVTEVFSHFSHVFLWNGSPVSLYPHPVPFHIDSRCLRRALAPLPKLKKSGAGPSFCLVSSESTQKWMVSYGFQVRKLLESRGLFSDMLGSGSVKQSVHQEIKWYEKRCFPYIMLCYIADHRILSQDFHSKLFCFNPCHMLHAHRASTALTASWQNLVFF